MQGIDTNVLVRFLVQDDPKQSLLANRFVEGIVRAGDSVFINHQVLCELVWVLEGPFKIGREAICEILGKLLITKEFMFEGPDVAKHALELFRSPGVDFSDALIVAKNIATGCKMTVTFDQKAARKIEAFKLLE